MDALFLLGPELDVIASEVGEYELKVLYPKVDSYLNSKPEYGVAAFKILIDSTLPECKLPYKLL